MIPLILIVLALAILFVIFCAAPAMAAGDVANRGIPGPEDAGLVLQASVTNTATFSGAGLDLGSGFAPDQPVDMAAVIDATAVDHTTGDETYAFTLEQSSDDSSFAACGVAPASPVAAGVVVARGLVSKRYVRLTVTIAGTSPSITYSANLNPNT